MTDATKHGTRIEVRDLTKRFGSITAVDNLSFTVEPGRITGFLGPNGAGKTTTLRMLLGLVRPDSGIATIGGERYSEIRTPQRVVGSALEATNFHPGRSGRNHLRVLADTAGIESKRVDEMLELVGIPLRHANGPAATPWACASVWGWRPHCSATPRCSCSTNQPTALTLKASGGCGCSCAT
jgi:ABC-type multidrug transport system, ATPase component